MNINLILVFIAFAISQSLVGQHGHLWNDLEIEKNRQYEGYIVDLSGDTTHGFIQFADRVTIQEQVYFFLEKSNKKTDTLLFPADLLWYHFLNKTYQCINYSGGLSSQLIKGNLVLERNCISKYVWFRYADNFASQHKAADESNSDFMERLYPSNEVYYHLKQRKSVTLDHFILDFERRMADFLVENEELVAKIRKRDRGYGSNDVLDIIAEYNESCP